MSRKNKDEFTREDLSDLAELHPPTLMPNGNVGTPTNIFMEFINDCKLPPGVIGKLGLTFPNKRGKRIYSSVPLDYGESVVKGNNDDYDAIITRKGQLIERVNASSLRCTGSCTDDNISTLDNEERVEDNTSEQVYIFFSLFHVYSINHDFFPCIDSKSFAADVCTITTHLLACLAKLLVQISSRVHFFNKPGRTRPNPTLV